MALHRSFVRIAWSSAVSLMLLLSSSPAMAVPDLLEVWSPDQPSPNTWYNDDEWRMEWTTLSSLGMYDAGSLCADLAVKGDVAYVAKDDGLLTLDISDPARLTPLDSYSNDLFSSIKSVTIEGNVAYLASSVGLLTLDVSDPSNIAFLGLSTAVLQVEEVTLAGSVAYVAAGEAGIAALNVADPSNCVLLGTYDTWGRAEDVFIDGDVAYVADGYGLVVLDVSNPSGITHLGDLAGTGWACDIEIEGDAAFAAVGTSGLRVFDVSVPASPKSLSGNSSFTFASAIEVAGDVAYIAAGDKGLAIADISDPNNTVLIDRFSTTGWISSLAVHGDVVFALDTWGGKVITVQVQQPTSLTHLDSSSSTTLFAAEVAGNVAYAVDLSGLAAFDVSDPAAITPAGRIEIGEMCFGLDVEGNVAYVASDVGGITSVNVSNPTNMQVLNTYLPPQVDSRYGYALDIEVAGDVAYVANGPTGLHLINVSDPSNMVAVGGASYYTLLEGLASGVAVEGDIAYVAYGYSGLRAVSVAQPNWPGSLGFFDTPGSAEDVAVVGDVAYVADFENGLLAINVSDPTNMTLLDSYDTPGAASRIAVEGDKAFVADDTSGVHMFDVSDPANLRLVETYAAPSRASGVAVEGDVLYAADSSWGLFSCQIASRPSGYSWILNKTSVTEPDSAIEGRSPSLYSACDAGEWYMHVRAVDRFGNAGRTLHRRLLIGPRATRLSDRTRYSTAVAIARECYDPTGYRRWTGVTDVVLASGEDGAAADPLAASGLCWAEDAPLFLTSSTSVPAEVKQAIKEIADANGKVTVHIVGGPVSVPDARYSELASYVGAVRLVKKRLLDSGDRYDMAAAVAKRVKERWGADPPLAVLVANGADPAKFFDALALSPITSAKGYPILLVKQSAVPASTRAALQSMEASRVIVGGGPSTVSDGVKSAVGSYAGVEAERWWGSTRYSTAIDIADKAIAAGWLQSRWLGVAAKLPDALTGGCMIGHEGGVLLVTDGTSLTSETGSWIEAHAPGWFTGSRCYVFGGTESVAPEVVSAIDSRLQ